MASNYGIGIGAFVNGLTNGMSTMTNLQDANSRRELRDMQVADLKEQRADRQQLRTTTQQGAADAAANTDGQLDNVVGYYMNNTAPKIVQHYLSTGEPEKADVYQKWISDANVQQGAKYGAGMIRAAAMKDLNGVGEYMVKAYNQPGYFDDGNTATGYNVIKNDKGEPTGLEFTLKGPDGKEKTHKLNSVDEVYKVAETFGNPLSVFNTGMQQFQQQRAAAQKTQTEIAREGRELNQKVQLGQIEQGYKLEGQNNQSMLKRAEEAEKNRTGAGTKVAQDFAAKVATLKQQGYSDEYIAKMTPSLIGIQNQAKPMNARIEDYIKVQTANDITGEFGKLSTSEQAKRAKEAIGEIDAQANNTSGPVQGMSLPGAQQPQQQGQGVPFYDTKTNSIVYR